MKPTCKHCKYSEIKMQSRPYIVDQWVRSLILWCAHPENNYEAKSLCSKYERAPGADDE